MGKNAHPPRGGNKVAKKPATPINGEDSSYIVFTNAKDEPPQKSSAAANGGAAPSASRGKAVKDAASQPATEDAPKKPDTRALIGGASWTGKLPMNMLSEHCQKQKWEKPEYTMVRYSLQRWESSSGSKPLLII